MAKDKSGGALVSAAQTLEAELRRFDDEVGAFAKLALTSRKSLERGRQFEDLGAGAAALNAKLKGDQTTVEVDAEVSALVSRAEQLVAQARAQHFDDVAHLADQLRQQVCAIRGKLLGRAGPAA